MKVCGKCGREVKDDAIFCTYCGVNIAESNQVAQEKEERPYSVVGQSNSRVQSKVEPIIQKLKTNKKIVVLIMAVVVIIAVLISVLVTINNKKKRTINIEDYLTVSFEGYEGYGTAYVYKDSDGLTEAINQVLEIDVDDDYDDDDYPSWEDIYNSLSTYGSTYELLYSIDVELDREENLSNGDIVTATITYDKDVADEYGLILTGEQVEFEVKGLEKLVELDPFENLEVSFEGTSPFVKISLEYTGKDDFLSAYNFNYENNGDIRSGDTVTITLSMDKEDAIYYGYDLTQTSKDYVCENVNRYLASAEEIDDDVLMYLQEEASIYIESKYAEQRLKISNSGLEYVGTFVLINGGWFNQNYAYVVYKTIVSSLEGEFEDTEIYIPVKIEDIIIYSDGNITSSDYYSIVGTTSLKFGWWSSVSGYEDPNDMYTDIISANRSTYECSMTEGMEQFSE